MSVTTYLQDRARAAVLSNDEERSINTSIATLKNRLENHFGKDLSEQFRFGSSTRGTILPRTMDEHSDIDYMIVFANDDVTPQAFLDRLKTFAETYYSRSDIKQSSPSVVLQLNHIKFDLVPALKNWLYGYRIPQGPKAWKDTNPNDFNAELTEKNISENSMIKPTIRLAKYWNACNGYVYDSFALEKNIVGSWFIFDKNLRDYLFTVFEGLTLPYAEAQWKKDKLVRAKEIIDKVRKLELEGMAFSAEAEIRRLIPS